MLAAIINTDPVAKAENAGSQRRMGKFQKYCPKWRTIATVRIVTRDCLPFKWLGLVAGF